MPQPLKSKGIKQIVLGDTTAARPKHAAAALEIIAEAARAELEVGNTLVALSPDNGRRLATHYNSQENDARKGATLEAIASVLLSEQDEDLLHRLLNKHKSLQKERTPFAHWLYAYDPKRDDLLILVNPKLELVAKAEIAFINHNWMYPDGEAKSPEERQAMIERKDETQAAALKGAWCYDLNELERIAMRLKAVRVYLTLFGLIVTWKGAQQARDELRRSLEQYLLDLESPSLVVTGGVQTRELQQQPPLPYPRLNTTSVLPTCHARESQDYSLWYAKYIIRNKFLDPVSALLFSTAITRKDLPMPSPILGLRTCIYKVADLAAAKAWYAKAFGAQPYFDEPFYVGFSIGGYELGLMPEEGAGERSDNVLTYWGVEDIEAEYRRFLGLGAKEHQAPTNVGGEIVVASVTDPWGNAVGLIFNPEFKRG